MRIGLLVSLGRWLVSHAAPKPPETCLSCAAKAEVLVSREAELARSAERESRYLANINDLQNKMAALADTRAAAVAARITADSGHDGPRPRVPRPRSPLIPAFASALSAGGHVDLRKVRDIASKRRLAQGSGSVAASLPPTVD